MDENKLLEVGKMYQTICDALNSKGLKYTKNDRDLTVIFTLSSGAKSFNFTIYLNSDHGKMKLHCVLPDRFSVNNSLDGAMACCKLNSSIDRGCFEVNCVTGFVLFKMSYYYMSSTVGVAAITEMLDYALATVSNANDDMSALSKGQIGLAEFYKTER